MAPYLNYLQPDRSQDVAPLLLVSFHRREAGEHGPVPICLSQPSTNIRDNDFVDEDLRISRAHSRNDVLQYEPSFIVGPIMQDLTEVVYTGACRPEC